MRYEPGRTIVVAGPDGKEVTYTLSTSASVPADVEIGRVVSLSTEPSPDGPATVTRVTVRSMTPDGQIKTETQTQSIDASGNQTMTETVDVTGTVSAFDPGKSVTLVLPDKKTVVYTLDSSSITPSDVAVGKTYTIQTTRTTANGPLVVKKITTTTTTTTKKSDQTTNKRRPFDSPSGIPRLLGMPVFFLGRGPTPERVPTGNSAGSQFFNSINWSASAIRGGLQREVPVVPSEVASSICAGDRSSGSPKGTPLSRLPF